MEVVNQRVDFGAPRTLVFAAIQLVPPDLQPIKKLHVFEWTPSGRVQRLEEAQRVLERLFAGDIGRKPDVIAFSEYSLPAEAHRYIKFQKLADEHHCVIIAGSYFENNQLQDELFRNNLCKIYIPGEIAPLTICKKNPAEGEKQFLRSSPSVPNVARLIWEPIDVEPVSISIFLCRDYLMPFRTAPTNTPGEFANKADRISLLDWEREGINIALMHNEKPAVFEAAAAFDIRETRGKRKIVLFVDSSNNQNLLSTAVIGAVEGKPQERDVVARMPPAAAGVLVFEASLWEPSQETKRPDKSLKYPVKYWECYSLPESDQDCPLVRLEDEKTYSARRGIFHPAFFLAYQRILILEFFVARSIKKIDEVFASRKLRHVTASHVRGIEDIVVLRYARNRQKMGSVPTLSEEFALPYSRLGRDQIRDVINLDAGAPFLRLSIPPEKIKKIRGVPVPELTEQKLIELTREVTRVTQHPTDLRAVIQIATDLPHGQDIPARYRSVFSLGIEDIAVIGKETQNRETFLFISSIDADGVTDSFRRLWGYVDSQIMHDPRVRDIYELNQIDSNPKHQNPPFQALLRLKCSVFDADEIILKLREWAGSKIRIGTRSYDLFKRISSSALRGISDARESESEIELEKAVCQLNDGLEFPTAELREELTRSLHHGLEQLSLGRFPDDWDIADLLMRFVVFVAAFNCTEDAKLRKKFGEEAGTYWNRLFKHAEDASSFLLIEALGLRKTANRDDVMDALRMIDKDYLRDRENRNGGYIKWFSDFYPRFSKSSTEVMAKVAPIGSDVAKFRNFSVHGGSQTDLVSSIGISGDTRVEKMRKLETNVRVMCDVLVAFADELNKRNLL